MLQARGEQSRRGRLLLMALGLAAVVAASVTVWTVAHIDWRRSLQMAWADPAPPLDPARERELRQTPVTEVAPSPLPVGIPLLGKKGVDRHGMPTQFVDGPGLRSLLFHEKYTDLTRAFEHFQREFETDPRKEYWPTDSASAFASAEPALRAALDAWVKATPGSFAPWVARGTYLNAVAWARRGGKYARETDPSDFEAMRKTFTEAIRDFERALAIAPQAIAAWQGVIHAFRGTSQRRKSAAAIRLATAQCPSCFQVRVAYLMGLRPRWGGSREQMLAFATSVEKPTGLLPLLRGYADWDESVTRGEADDALRASAAIDRACALGDHWEFLLQRAHLRNKLGDQKTALADLAVALRLRPGEPDLLMFRQAVLARASRFEEAGRDLLAGLRLRPTHHLARGAQSWIVKGLIYQGWEKYKVGKREEAIPLFDLAAEINPADPEVLRRRAFVLEGRAGTNRDPQGTTPPDLEAMRRRVKENPDDLRAHQQLDYNLTRQQRFPEIVEMWTGYLARHPNDGRAYLERGGAYFHLRKMKEAKADAAKACTLGISEGCRHAK